MPAQASIHGKEGDDYGNDFEEPEPVEEAPEEDIEVGPALKTPDDIYGYPIFPPGTNSLLKKYMTRELWSNMKGLTDEAGFSFKQAIFRGCKNTDTIIGIVAGSHNSYHAFAEIFDKIIEDYHGHAKQAKHTTNLNAADLKVEQFSAKEAKLIKSTRIRIGRNLEGFPLGPAVTKEQRDQIMHKAVAALEGLTGDLKGKFHPLGSLSAEEKAKLIQEHLLFKENSRFMEASFLNRDWPEGRGIFMNEAKTFIVWVNEEDQLRIISMQQGADLAAVFTRLSHAATEIHKALKFQHDDHLGYITTCPSNLGTALRASVHAHLPHSGKNMDELKALAALHHLQVRGADGEHTATDDHIFDISNEKRLGRTEVQLVQDMFLGIKQILAHELALTPPEEMKNQDVGSHLKKVEDLTGFPVFPAGTKSLLSKYLTKETYEKLH